MAVGLRELHSIFDRNPARSSALALRGRPEDARAAGVGMSSGLLYSLDRWRHRIPFWWWLTYDALVAVVIVAGIKPSDPAFWLGFAVLFVAVVIDAVEFAVKRPSARVKLGHEQEVRVSTETFLRLAAIARDRDCNLAAALDLVMDEYEPKALYA